LLAGKHVPIIGMTAYALEGSKEACIASGMDNYLSKPIDPVLLGSLLNQYLPGAVIATTTIAPISDAVCLEPVNFDSLRKRYGEENVAVFIDLFLVDTPVRLTQLQKAFNESELEVMLDTVHCLKGSSASVFAPGLRRICESMESDLRDNGINSNVECILAEIFEEFEKIQTYVMSQRSLTG
jgi:CheY-like chemotaxis protein